MIIRNKKTGQKFNVMANSRFSAKLYEIVDERAEKIALEAPKIAPEAPKAQKTTKQSRTKKKTATKRNKSKATKKEKK